jgi:hypothetical protein
MEGSGTVQINYGSGSRRPENLSGTLVLSIRTQVRNKFIQALYGKITVPVTERNIFNFNTLGKDSRGKTI